MMKKLLQMVTLIFALALISPNTFGQNQALSINPSGQVVNPVANIYFPLGATGQFSGTFTGKASGDGGGLTNLTNGVLKRSVVFTKANVGGFWQSLDTGSQQTESSSNTNNTYKIRHFVTDNSGNLQFVFGNSANGSWKNANPITVKYSLFDTNGVRYPIYFGGQRTVTIQPGQFVISDILPKPVYRGEIYYSLTDVSFAAGGTITLTFPSNPAINEGVVANVDYTDTGTVGSSYGYNYGPVAVLGDVPVSQVMLAINGDSIFSDYGACDANLGGFYYNPQILQALGPDGTYGANYANIALAMQGDGFTGYASATNGGFRKMFDQLAGYEVSDMGHNDLNQGTNFLVAGLTNYWAIKAAIGQVLFQTTYLPHGVSSTDHYATTNNQTLNLSYETPRRWMNSWLRAVLVSGQTNYPGVYLCDMATSVEAGTNSGYWIPGYTYDGNHPGSAGSLSNAMVNASMVAVFTNQIVPLMVPRLYNPPTLVTGSGVAQTNLALSGTFNGTFTGNGVGLTNLQIGDANYNALAGGIGNSFGSLQFRMFIAGGQSNYIGGGVGQASSSIIGSTLSTNLGTSLSAILGGQYNYNSESDGSILAGSFNTLGAYSGDCYFVGFGNNSGGQKYLFDFGRNITNTANYQMILAPNGAGLIINSNGVMSGNGGGLTNLFAGTFVNVLQAGCTNDGVTDNTVALNKLAGLGNVLLFPPGNYIVTNTVYPTNGTVFYGYGATLTFNGTNVGPLINTAHTANWAILGLTLDGLGYGTNLGYYAFITNTGPSTTMASFTNAENNNPLGRWNGASQRHGIFCNNNFGTIHDVIIRGFNGAALYPYNTNGQSAHATARTVVNGLTCYSNFIGICASPVGTVSGSSAVPWFTNWVNVPTAWTTSGNGCDAQYMVFQNCNCFCNEVGASIGGANNIFIGCNFDNNYHQLLAGGDGSVSGITGHGRVANCSVNHGYSTPIILVNPLGYSIDNCSIRANGGSGIQIYGNSAYDISIKNCDFDAPPVLTENFLGGGNYNIFANNKYAGAWNANLIANLDGHLRIYGNVSTTVAGDTDGSGLALVGYNNGSGLTNLQAGSLTGTLPTLYLTNSGNTGFVVTNVTTSGVGLGTSYTFGTNGLLRLSSLGAGGTFCPFYYDSSGAIAISMTSSAGGYIKITGCSGLMASNLVAINTITATNGYISSPITGSTSDLFDGYSTNGTKIFQVDSNGVVNGNGSGLTNLFPIQPMSTTTTLPSASSGTGLPVSGAYWTFNGNTGLIFPVTPALWANSGQTNVVVYAYLTTTNAGAFNPTVLVSFSTNQFNGMYGKFVTSSNNFSTVAAAGTNTYLFRVPFSVPLSIITNAVSAWAEIVNNTATGTNTFMPAGPSYIWYQ